MSYDRADRITAAGSTPYTVDAAGNLTARGSDSFTYDQANRLKTATVEGQLTTYVYGGNGNRVSKTVGANPTVSYVNDVTAPLSQVLTDGTLKYVYGLGLVYAVDSSNNVQVYHDDGLGSVRAITDGSGNVIQAYQTDEVGTPTQNLGASAQPFQYTGQLRDTETGFYDLRTRMYDPATGRFTSRDPLAGSLANPSSLNRYAYAGNNPVSGVDPGGLDPGCQTTETPASCVGGTVGGAGPSEGISLGIDLGAAVDAAVREIGQALEGVHLRLP